MQADAGGDVYGAEAIAFKSEDVMMLRRAQCQQPLPKIVGPNNLAGPRLRGRPLHVREGNFSFQGAPMLAIAIDEAIASGLDQKCPQLLRIAEERSRAAHPGGNGC